MLIDGDFSCSDSSVICAYLDEAYPGHALFPADPKDRARARWLEEFADTRLGDVFIWGLFYQKVVHPLVWGEPGDAARIEKSLNEDIPAALDYLEGELPAEASCSATSASPTSASPPSSATALTPASASTPRGGRLPPAFVERTLAHPCIADLLRFEDVQRNADIKGRRQALLDAGRGSPKRPWACANRARG